MHSNNLFDEIKKINSEMESQFYRLFSPKHPLQSLPEEKWQPYTDVFETKDALMIKMELAGVKKEDLSVGFFHGRLIIRGVRRDLPSGDKRIYYQMEINYSEFERVVILPEAVKEADIRAEYKDGFLTITVLKDPVQIIEEGMEIKVE
ncbi:MAG: Hsp20/alpha crystallin family protein [Candidatus Methanolliviera sp. GoM_oil]|nr:MAG: Hsp20/alpha crystallin family protein [Candidatus Methanolliviera sp. GoM_oil]